MTVYVTHTCKRCGRAFIAEDLYNARDLPPKNKYCPKCEKEGFKNKKKRIYTEEEIKVMKERMKMLRERRKKKC